MARGKLWSVKGVSPKARDAARAAAQESGQPIGVWVDQAIRMNGENRNPESETTAAVAEETTQPDIVTILQALEQRVADHADRIAEQLAPVCDSINNLSARLERLEVGNPPRRETGPSPQQKTPSRPPVLTIALRPPRNPTPNPDPPKAGPGQGRPGLNLARRQRPRRLKNRRRMSNRRSTRKPPGQDRPPRATPARSRKPIFTPLMLRSSRN